MFPRILLVLALTGCVRPASSPRGAESIAWTTWSPEAFARARREHKLVLVDAGIEGCTACGWMHAKTYRDPEIVRRLNERFIAVSVDADQQPDLGERFEPWGWPATIVLSSDGAQLRAIQGFEPPESFRRILDEISSGRLERKAEEQRSPGRDASVVAICVDAERELRSRPWPLSGGIGIVVSTPLEHAALRAHVYGDDADLARVKTTARGYAKLVDPVWGGVFVASRGMAFTEPIFEKRMLQQAYALEAFATASRQGSDAELSRAADRVNAYVRDWMTAPSGAFYSTQRDAAPNLGGMTVHDYWALPDEERRKRGIPPIDHGVYADQNGVVVLAYVKMYEATGAAAWLRTAERAMAAILWERRRPGGWIAQIASSTELAADARLRLIDVDDRLFLRPQVDVGLALVALHRATGAERWLDAARGIASTLSRLEDREGGFFSVEPRETDLLVARRVPFYENAVAARFLWALAALTKDETLRVRAERALVRVAPFAREETLTALGHFALAVEEAVLGPVEMSVVGDPSDPRAIALHGAALRMYEPRKILHYERAGRYPDRDRPALYVCTKESCSSPVYDPSEAPTTIARIAQIRDGAGCRKQNP